MDNQPTQPAQPPNPALPPAGPPEPQKVSKKGKIALITAITAIFLLTVGVFATVLYRSMTDKKAPVETMTLEEKLNKYQSTADLNKQVASKPYFKVAVPTLDCGPSDALHATNFKRWVKDWVYCLEVSWRESATGIADAKSTRNIGAMQTTFADTPADGPTKCKADTSTEQLAFYCAPDNELKILKSTGKVDGDLATIFHEFTHHLQDVMGVDVAPSDIQRMYRVNPDQPYSAAKAEAIQASRMEINAECSSYTMLASSGRLNAPGGQAQLNLFKNPTPEFVGNGYGSTQIRERFINASASDKTAGACNAWLYADNEIIASGLRERE